MSFRDVLFPSLNDFRGNRDSLEDPLDLFGGRAQTEATDLRRRLSDEGLAFQSDLFDQLFSDRAPVLDARNQALGLLGGLQDGSFSPFLDPSLEFRKKEGIRDIRRGAASTGRLNSGQQFIDEQNLSAGLQSEAANNAVQRILNLAGFSTGDLGNQNPILQGNIGTRSGSLYNRGLGDAGDILNRRSNLNYGLNAGAGLLGYYGGF